MATVTFEIAPSYVDTFKKYRKIKGGCILPVRKTDTGELGSLLLVHQPSLDRWNHVLEKVKWVVSCYCPYDEKSPFGGNKTKPVKTVFVEEYGLLTVSLVENNSDLNPVRIIDTGFRRTEQDEEEDRFRHDYLHSSQEIERPDNMQFEYNEEYNFFYNSEHKVILFAGVYYQLDSRDYQLIEITCM